MNDAHDTKTEELAARLHRLEDRERRQRRWTRGGLAAVLLGGLSIPLSALGLGPVPHIFSAGDPITAAEMNENFAFLQGAITAVEANVPTGTVAFFDLDACPTGWSEYTAARGRTLVGTPSGGTRGMDVGSALADGALRTISDVPAHSHALSGNGTQNTSSVSSHSHSASSGSAGSHSHSGTALTAGVHTHSLALEVAGNYGTGYLMGTVNSSGGNVTTSPMSSSGGHSHNLTVNSGGAHTHSVTIGSGGGHLHSVDLSGISVDASGNATVDVTMPYTQLLVCRRD